jgi:hypothetical protein
MRTQSIDLIGWFLDVRSLASGTAAGASKTLATLKEISACETPKRSYDEPSLLC